LSRRPIWFMLFDSVSGMAYKETRAFMVMISTEAPVEEFRFVVKTRYADTHLADVATSELHVYKTKASFDKRNDAQAMEVPLSPDYCLTKPLLGASRDDPIIVEVPATSTKSYLDVETNCEGCFDVIASRLSTFYVFDCQIYGRPTIGDLLAAKNGREGIAWNVCRATRDGQQLLGDVFTRIYKKGEPYVNTKLPEVYTEGEWEKIKAYTSGISKEVDAEMFVTELKAFLNDIDMKAFLLPCRDLPPEDVWSGYEYRLPSEDVWPEYEDREMK
jgi:hypothetical protein